MNTKNVPFTITDWNKQNRIEYRGKNGTSYWRIFEKENSRVRMVEYSTGFNLIIFAIVGMFCWCWKEN